MIIQLVLWAGEIITMTRGWEKLGALVQVTALAVLAFLPGTFLAGAFPFFRWGASAYWAFVLGFSVAMALACHFACRCYLADPLMTMLGVIIAFLSVDIITGGALQFNTVFCYTPTVAGRFDGMGNPAFSMFTASAIILAALIAYRVPGRRAGDVDRAAHLGDPRGWDAHLGRRRRRGADAHPNTGHHGAAAYRHKGQMAHRCRSDGRWSGCCDWPSDARLHAATDVAYSSRKASRQHQGERIRERSIRSFSES